MSKSFVDVILRLSQIYAYNFQIIIKFDQQSQIPFFLCHILGIFLISNLKNLYFKI